ncbi:MAG: hypothetical protein R3344_09405, partial [Acidobacteriota bacterium]|nr:hypothetical protein [Acidobacteriota bacterium]
MRVETRCASCGNSFLIDSEGRAGTPCPVCGEPVASGARPVASAAPASGPAAPKVETASTRPQGDDNNVVCPRCGLHFVPKKADVSAAPSQAPEQHTDGDPVVAERLERVPAQEPDERLDDQGGAGERHGRRHQQRG